MLACGSRHGRWRADLETCVFVRAQEAAAARSRFLLATNDIYLAPDGIPAQFVDRIIPWRSGMVPSLPVVPAAAVEVKAQRAFAGAVRMEEPGRDKDAPPLSYAGCPPLESHGTPAHATQRRAKGGRRIPLRRASRARRSPPWRSAPADERSPIGEGAFRARHWGSAGPSGAASRRCGPGPGKSRWPLMTATRQL